MKILFSTGSLHHLSLRETFMLSKETGFDGCDIVVNTSLDHEHYKEAVQECKDILPIYAIHAPFFKLLSWGNPIEALAKTIAVAKDLAIPVVNFHPPSWFYLEIKFLKWFMGIRDFQKELGAEEVAVALETMPRIGKSIRLAPYVVNDFKDCLKFGMERNLYFTLDTTHIATFDYEIVPVFLALFKSGRLKHLHLSDYEAPNSHLFIGSGTLPLVRLLNTMKAVGYKGTISLEVSPGELPSTRERLKSVMTYASSFLKINVGREKDG